MHSTRQSRRMAASSNLQVFLDAATPRLPWRSPPAPPMEGPDDTVWRQMEYKKDAVEDYYFTLQDLWDHYSESSAYGLSVPVRLHRAGAGDSVIITQHFVPYLSALQIYTAGATTNNKATLAAMPLPTRSSTGSETDSWSDDSVNKDSGSWDAASDDDDSSSQDDDVGSVSVVVVPARKRGGYNLIFQYCELDPPYERIPLADKVAELAQDYPCLTSLTSAELAPSSWLAVAWYPIYHIPHHGRNHLKLKGTSACFLTYHTISSAFQDRIVVRRGGGDRTVALSPFGLATNRMEAAAGKRLWTDPLPPPPPPQDNLDAGNGGGGSSTPPLDAMVSSASSTCSRLPSSLSNLYWAASSWLKQVGARHPDFNFFAAH